MPTRNSKPRRSGRPAEIDPQRLLDAAQKLFAERGFDGASTRELARAAHCNVAMISYHFGSKEGLYRALLDRHFKRIHETLERALDPANQDESRLRADWPELADPDQRRFCESLFKIARIILTEGEMQQIVSREIMTGGRNIISSISQDNAGVAGPLRESITALMRAGKLAPELDWKLGVISLLGPLVYSCIAEPLLKAVYGVQPRDEKYLRALCLHLTTGFFGGFGR